MRVMTCLVACAAILILALQPARAEDMALVLADRGQSSFFRGDAEASSRDFVEPLRASGFRVIEPDTRDARALRRAALSLENALQQDEVDRLVLVLSGPFAHGPRDSWLLSDEAFGATRVSVAATGLSMTMLSDLAAQAKGRPVVLIPPGRDPRTLGAGLSPGLGPFTQDARVTYVTGPFDDLVPVLRDRLLAPGRSLAAAANRAPSSVSFSGFTSAEVGLMGAVDRVDPARLVEKGYWRAAQALDTIAAYQSYLAAYRSGGHRQQARERIDWLEGAPERQAKATERALGLSRSERREIQRDLETLGFYGRAIDGIFGAGTRAAIKEWQRDQGLDVTGYLTGNQISRIRNQARAREREIEQEQRRRDNAYWRETGRGGDEAGLRAYLDRYPDGLHAEEARKRLAEIEADKEEADRRKERRAWRDARDADTAESYRAYLERYPDGPHADQARARLSEIAQAQEERAWHDARETDTVDAYRSFLNAYPQSRFAPQALRRLKALTEQQQAPTTVAQAKAEERTVAATKVARLLIEKRLQQMGLDPGGVDGNFTDKTRQAIRDFQRGNDIDVTGYVSQMTMVRLMTAAIEGR
ncbi:peptidoglycan-binding domain-containing protein [Roseovarius salinarum]|uniref:peptidoglycan-binding domain-containing protein n=1 Tax=Roseovarius salinarum TaxID=1981892 RepID=UPI000C34A48F|nr:peptidoglycan-binding domain-containing protein [Roseovarius salinarum]